MDSMKLEIPNHPIMLKAVASALERIATEEALGGGVSEALKHQKLGRAESQSTVAETKGDSIPFTKKPDIEEAKEAITNAANTPTTETAPQSTELNLLDSEGLPWDARIHSSGKSRMKSNDTWKLKKGVDPQLVEQVKAELKALNSNTTEQVTPAPPSGNVPPPPSTGTVPPPPTTTAESAPASMEQEEDAEQSISITATDAPVSFTDLLNLVIKLQNEGVISDMSAFEVSMHNDFGVKSIAELATMPEKWEELQVWLVNYTEA